MRSGTLEHPAVRAKPGLAFTIVEILVAMAVLLALAAISSVVYGNAMASARSSQCMSNERQLALGMLAYSADYDGFFPKALAATETFWTKQVKPYTRTEASHLQCPNHEMGREHLWPQEDSGYAANRCVSGKATVNPRAILLAEAADEWISPPATTYGPVFYLGKPDNFAFDSTEAPPGKSYAHLGVFGALRHRGASHYALVDGHVALKPPAAIAFNRSGDECSATLQPTNAPPSAPVFPDITVG